MKKTVLAVCFALVGTLVMAQPSKQQNAVVSKQLNNQVQYSASSGSSDLSAVGYNGSIFMKSAKGEGDVLYECRFTKNGQKHHFGSVDPNNYIIADAYGPEISSYTQKKFMWNSYDSATVGYLNTQGLATDFPRSNAWFGGAMAKSISEYMDSNNCSSNDGFAIMTVFEQATIEGKAFNNYIRFNSFEIPEEVNVIDFQLYQWYMKFYDKCYVDYRTENMPPDEWKSMEINVTGVDIDVNARLNGTFTYTLPVRAVYDAHNSTASPHEITLSLRWYSNPSKTTDGFGYLWMVDDVKVIAGGDNRLSSQLEYYTFGAYQLMPQGLELPLYWHAKAVNTGSLKQKNITASIYNYYEGEDADQVASATMLELSAGTKEDLHVDPAGLRSNSGDGENSVYGWGCGHAGSGIINEGSGTGMLNTSKLGNNYVYARLNSYTDEARQNVNCSYNNYDTVQYIVVDSINDGSKFQGSYVWGHDNGVLTVGQAYIYGHVKEGSNTYITDASKNYSAAGYRVTVRYTMGNKVPVDAKGEPWVIRGMELVPATDSIIRNGNATINPVLYKDVCSADAQSVSFTSLKTGVVSYDIDTNEVSTDFTVSSMYESGYLRYDEYSDNTIRIAFPEQPVLEPGESYRVGYSLNEAANFAVATSTGNYYWQKDLVGGRDTVISHSFIEEGAKSLASHFARTGMVDNAYDVQVYDPEVDEGYNNIWAGNFYNRYPMIHLIIGPRVQYDKYTVYVSCETESESGEELGYIANANRTNICVIGKDTVSEGSEAVYYLFTQVVDDLLGKVKSFSIDGTVIFEDGDFVEETSDDIVITGDEEDGFSIVFKNVNSNHEISAVFEESESTEGIYALDNNVSMSLQPNPATNQVRLSVEGVSGMVECAVIDMSGRSVYSSKFDAEGTHTISLSDIAKGAYFVRINNSEFSKVEKLIVR